MGDYPWREYGSIAQKHVASCKLFATREDMMRQLAARRRFRVIAEIGVAFGDFSEVLLRECRPKAFYGFDLFTIHEWPLIWGKPPGETFGALTHEQYYLNRFSGRNVRTVKGRSWETLAEFPDEFFDLVYVDGDHEFDGVNADAVLAKKKVKRGGVLIFDDYIMYDHAGSLAYGVVPVVNNLILKDGFQMVGFALEKNLFCNVALRRP